MTYVCALHADWLAGKIDLYAGDVQRLAGVPDVSDYVCTPHGVVVVIFFFFLQNKKSRTDGNLHVALCLCVYVCVVVGVFCFVLHPSSSTVRSNHRRIDCHPPPPSKNASRIHILATLTLSIYKKKNDEFFSRQGGLSIVTSTYIYSVYEAIIGGFE